MDRAVKMPTPRSGCRIGFWSQAFKTPFSEFCGGTNPDGAFSIIIDDRLRAIRFQYPVSDDPVEPALAVPVGWHPICVR